MIVTAAASEPGQGMVYPRVEHAQKTPLNVSEDVFKTVREPAA